jgi:hypothetical protein
VRGIICPLSPPFGSAIGGGWISFYTAYDNIYWVSTNFVLEKKDLLSWMKARGLGGGGKCPPGPVSPASWITSLSFPSILKTKVFYTFCYIGLFFKTENVVEFIFK